MTEAYPLSWPDGWPRTPAHKRVDGRGIFGKMVQETGRTWRSKRPLTFAQARDSLYDALRKVDAREVVLSTNFQLNSYGQPRGDRRRPDDEGVAVYFRRKGRHFVMARDAFTRAEENMRSLALALEAMAQLERHGGDLMTERAFTGFAALPPPRSCWEILGVKPGASPAEVRSAWRVRAADAHPDVGGSNAAMAELNAARDAALKLLEGAA